MQKGKEQCVNLPRQESSLLRMPGPWDVGEVDRRSSQPGWLRVCTHDHVRNASSCLTVKVPVHFLAAHFDMPA